MRILLLILSLFALAACQADDPTATAVANITPPIAPTDTPPPSPPPANTAAPLPTDAPTLTPTITPASTPTPPPTNTPIPENPAASITLVPIISGGLTKPVFLTHAGDGRLFIVEQPGQIKIWADGVLLPQPFLDVSGRVSTNANERGLFSIAFHPDYGENGRFFINYTNRDGNTVISRWQVDPDNPDRANPDSEAILLTIRQPYGNHNGGGMAFGPDGYLYIGMGDGGSADDPEGNGQNPATLLGTMLRIDVDHEGNGALYSIPPDNPFVNDNAARNEIWATGLRNPWRFSFDRLSGDLYIADVGQNLWEEAHVQPAGSPGGENYGWNILEGTHCFLTDNCDPTGLEQPIFEYDHSLGCSITGGYVYRGQKYLALYGNYFAADFCTGVIWRLFPKADGSWDTAVLLQSGLNISSFGEDVNGELYLLDHTGGAVYQIQ